jgi:hypothetical protein
MTHRLTQHLRTALLTWEILVLCACRHSEMTSVVSRFAVEFPRQDEATGILSNRYVIVYGGGLTSTEMPDDSLRPLPRRAAGIGRRFTLKLDFTTEHNKVVTTVYTIPPESEPLRYSDGHKRLLGTHSARLNETVELPELKTIGYQPLTLKIVSAQPKTPSHPTIISEVPSIQVDFDGEDLVSYTLLLRNVSSRGVVAYALDEGGDSDSLSISRVVGNFYGRPVIAPRAAKKQMIVEDPSQRRIVVAAAVFTDGSHEGNDDLAARLKSGQIGYRTQHRRIEPSIDRIIRDAALDDDRRLARIREELHNLSDRPDAEAIRAMRSQFPDLQNDVVVKDLTDAFDSARQNIWGGVYGYAHSSGTWPPPSHPPPLAEWWRTTREAIGRMLPAPE